MSPQAYAQIERCQEKLYASNCTLLDCGEKCWNKHHEPKGYDCAAKLGRGELGTIDYDCYCFFNCAAA